MCGQSLPGLATNDCISFFSCARAGAGAAEAGGQAAAPSHLLLRPVWHQGAQASGHRPCTIACSPAYRPDACKVPALQAAGSTAACNERSTIAFSHLPGWLAQAASVCAATESLHQAMGLLHLPVPLFRPLLCLCPLRRLTIPAGGFAGAPRPVHGGIRRRRRGATTNNHDHDHNHDRRWIRWSTTAGAWWTWRLRCGRPGRRPSGEATPPPGEHGGVGCGADGKV